MDKGIEDRCNMASVTLKLANPQCGGASHLVGTKINLSKDFHTSSSQTSVMSFARKPSTLSDIKLQCRRGTNDFGLGKQNTSQHAPSRIICSMSSCDTPKGDISNYHEVKLIDANCLRAEDKNVFIKYNNGKEMKAKYMKNQPGRLASETDTESGDLTTSTPCMFFQSISAPACILAISTTEEIVDRYTDRARRNQFLRKGAAEKYKHVKFTGVWLTGGENGEYKLTFKIYLKKVEMECKFEMSIHALKIALEYDVPIYVHRDVLRADGLRFPSTIFRMEAREASFVMLLVNMRRDVAVAEGRFSDAAFWESAGLACDIDTIVMGPSTNWDGTLITKT